MLLWSRRGRALARGAFLVLFVALFGFPVATVALMAIARGWNGTLPSGLTLEHLGQALQGAGRASLVTSLVTGLLATAVSLVVGSWAALARRGVGRRGQRLVDALFLVPIAVPSVVVGLGLLVTFSRPPLALNGLPVLVIVAHAVLVTAFAYGNISAALARVDHSYADVAASLGARPRTVLLRITLPLLTPALVAAAGLSFALSMGELGATFLVYPASWVTLPVGIFSLSDRGQSLDAAASTVVLLAATLAVLVLMSRIRTRASYR